MEHNVYGLKRCGGRMLDDGESLATGVGQGIALHASLVRT